MKFFEQFGKPKESPEQATERAEDINRFKVMFEIARKRGGLLKDERRQAEDWLYDAKDKKIRKKKISLQNIGSSKEEYESLAKEGVFIETKDALKKLFKEEHADVGERPIVYSEEDLDLGVEDRLSLSRLIWFNLKNYPEFESRLGINLDIAKKWFREALVEDLKHKVEEVRKSASKLEVDFTKALFIGFILGPIKQTVHEVFEEYAGLKITYEELGTTEAEIEEIDRKASEKLHGRRE